MQGWKLLIYILHIISWTWIVIIMINSLKSLSTSYHMFCKYYWFFGIKGFFNGIKNSSFFLTWQLCFLFIDNRKSFFSEAHFGCTFWKEDENIKKKFIQCTLTMMSKVAGQSRQLPDIVWTEKFSLAFSSDKLKVDRFTFIH